MEELKTIASSLEINPKSADISLAGFQVVCLCADWCAVCREYRSGFREVALQFPAARFRWLDVEEHADEMGNLDVENFPTLLIKREEWVLFFGVLRPSPAILKRTIEVFFRQSPCESQEYALASAERRAWQKDVDLARATSLDFGEIVSQKEPTAK